ncbi:D-ribose pyranase [Streptomyces erythrochromogenes]|uniref:D-ribose pyranase n=1 Tax=Streptomyces erythrochromogenes TaxID=285574 RepID=UPI003682AC89
MKKTGILNRHLAGALAELGHTDLVVVCDAGLPIPPGPTVVDLAFTPGTPSFADILHGLLQEITVEAASAAKQAREANPEAIALLTRHFDDLELISHEDLKARTRTARLVVRTGEARPYANVILRCGVPF